MSSNTPSDDAEEPVAWMFQHEDTGLIDYVDTQQVEWGFEKNNPRWQKIGPVYTRPKPAEPEAEYDFYGVIPLTHRKAKGIIKDRGYHVTGFVLSRPDGDKCIVDMSAVRWLSGKEFFEMMHPPVVSPTAEPEAETIETLQAENFKLASGQCTEGGPWGDEGGTPYCKYAEPAARKPMTEEEIDEAIATNEHYCERSFAEGVRYAEKHHLIGGADE